LDSLYGDNTSFGIDQSWILLLCHQGLASNNRAIRKFIFLNLIENEKISYDESFILGKIFNNNVILLTIIKGPLLDIFAHTTVKAITDGQSVLFFTNFIEKYIKSLNSEELKV
jgi:hypothetical protein